MVKNIKKYLFFSSLLLVVLPTKGQYDIILSIDSVKPTCLTLNDGNIFIVAEKGIYVYDHLNNNYNIIMNFTSELMIDSDEECSKVTLMQLPDDDGGNIFCLAKDILYVFSNNYILLENFTLSEETDVNYYSLSFLKKDSNFEWNFGNFRTKN